MKKILLTLLFFCACISANAQHVITSEKFGFSFKSPETLEYYDEESDSFLGYENDNYAVDIEIIPHEFESRNSTFNLKEVTQQAVLDMRLKTNNIGQKIHGLENSFYVLASDTQAGDTVPVFVAVIINLDRQYVYVITVDCYNSNIKEGEKIVQSFRLID